VIELPRRSVTRFFVPLIDVLILLFCIFLLMPFVSDPNTANSGATDPQSVSDQGMSGDVVTLQRELLNAQKELKRIQTRANRGDLAENLSVKVLEIDKTNGRIMYFDPDRKEISDQKEAQLLIDKHLRLAGTREPFFLILYPRELSGYPEQQQIENYRRWFRDVPHGFDNPLAVTR